ncbi:MAG: enoyl-CoA hydratase-related protein [Dehalococcoidia bacterium]|nr:enoyl-CoA hydratase-related protein [Dehalococcoidia bacterium]
MVSEPKPHVIELTISDGVALLTLNRPPVNALNQATLKEIAATLERCASDPHVRVVIIASAFPNVFSAGADLQELKGLRRPSEIREFAASGQAVCDQIESLPQPVIAAVRGVAPGGACELAMACDLRVAGQSARFGQPEVNLGFVPGWGGTQRLPRLIGRTAALELLMTGELITAERALALGLVNRVVPDDQVLAEARRIAEVLLTKPPKSLMWIKQAVHQGLDQSLRDGLALEAGLFSQSRATQDAQEGIQAFLEKRQPRFGGH